MVDAQQEETKKHVNDICLHQIDNVESDCQPLTGYGSMQSIHWSLYNVVCGSERQNRTEASQFQHWK